MFVRAVLGDGLGELARPRAEKDLWGKRSSSPSSHHRSGGAMRVRAVLGEGLGELARLRAEKPLWGKTLLLAIIASCHHRSVWACTHTHVVCMSLYRVHVHVHVHVHG